MIELEDTEEKITQEEILEFENNNYLVLPLQYRLHLLKFNGGYPKKPVYFKGYPVDEFTAIKYGDYPMQKRIENLSDFLPDKSIPFSSTTSGIIYISTLDNNKVYVKYPDGQTDFLANSFKEFMDGLKNEPYDF